MLSAQNYVTADALWDTGTAMLGVATLFIVARCRAGTEYGDSKSKTFMLLAFASFSL